MWWGGGVGRGRARRACASVRCTLVISACVLVLQGRHDGRLGAVRVAVLEDAALSPTASCCLAAYLCLPCMAMSPHSPRRRCERCCGCVRGRRRWRRWRGWRPCSTATSRSSRRMFQRCVQAGGRGGCPLDGMRRGGLHQRSGPSHGGPRHAVITTRVCASSRRLGRHLPLTYHSNTPKARAVLQSTSPLPPTTVASLQAWCWFSCTAAAFLAAAIQDCCLPVCQLLCFHAVRPCRGLLRRLWLLPRLQQTSCRRCYGGAQPPVVTRTLSGSAA